MNIVYAIVITAVLTFLFSVAWTRRVNRQQQKLIMAVFLSLYSLEKDPAMQIQASSMFATMAKASGFNPFKIPMPDAKDLPETPR